MTLETVQEKKDFALFAIVPQGQKKLGEGWINLHLALWKYLIYNLTIVATEEAKFQAHEVWGATLHRLEQKVLAKQESLRTSQLMAESRGLEPPDLTTRASCMAPWGVITDDGIIHWDDLRAELKLRATPPPKRRITAH